LNPLNIFNHKQNKLRLDKNKKNNQIAFKMLKNCVSQDLGSHKGPDQLKVHSKC